MLSKRSAFSLVEIMIVVALLADVIIIAMPAFQRSRRQAQNSRFASDLRTCAAAFEMYAAENNKYPPEAGVAQLPVGMDQYLRGVNWNIRNSIGGNWDWDYDQGYARAAVCSDQPNDADPLQMVDIDTKVDNGILSTGVFRERSARRYAYIIE
jgi:type II secretory pathway pseudopilin PulG